ncbi:MAG: sugar ABC transporter substrate-binding protein [Lachnospiraceae bacterium]|nr:sugar ABC transporter substrate-binding protein [Lachnospiraceae bacterium]
MMKKGLSILLAGLMVMSLTACGGTTAETTAKETAGTETTAAETTEAVESTESAEAAEKTGGSGYNIGFAVQTLGNQVWAQQADAIQSEAEADGNTVTVVDCNENANTQINQLENFITSGVDEIIVNPVDAEAIEDTCKKAREAGIKVVSWDEEMENSDVNWVIKNYDLGAVIGEQAAEFINEKFGDEGCEVAVLGYPQTPILLERENGILDKLAELAPNAKVVANQPAINPTDGLNAMETILQANPEVKVVCTIGGGGAAGANEALKANYGSEVPDDIGIFSTDLTDETISSMENGEFNRMVVAITGNAYVCGRTAYELGVELLDGTTMDKNVYRDLIPVTSENMEEMVNQK